MVEITVGASEPTTPAVTSRRSDRTGTTTSGSVAARWVSQPGWVSSIASASARRKRTSPSMPSAASPGR